MKYLIIIVVLAVGYWVYENYYSIESTSLSIAEKIEADGSVKASEVLSKSRELVQFVCKDDEVLSSWGSSSEACFDRVSNFGEMCEERIFPNHEKKVTSNQEAKDLMARYNKCVIPS